MPARAVARVHDTIEVSRAEVLRFRFRRHGLHHDPNSVADPVDLDIVDYGIQDTGPDGSAWALVCRGAAIDELGPDMLLAWTLRGAPHAYRRTGIAAVAVATAPLSEADAAKRIFDAAKPLKAAGIPILDALTEVADHMRDIVTSPMPKGDVSGELTRRLDKPFLRFCRPCDTTHIYEMPFRLSALQAGLEIEADSSPPVLRRIARVKPRRYRTSGGSAAARFDVVRNHLRFYGPARPRDIATFLDTSASVVNDHLPDDTAAVTIADTEGAGHDRLILSDDVDELAESSGSHEPAVRLVGPYDPYLQLRDRELLVPDQAKRKDLWRVLGRPGAILADGEVIGTWRPKSSGRKLTVRIDLWEKSSKAVRGLVADEAERLAAHRGVTFNGLSDD